MIAAYINQVNNHFKGKINNQKNNVNGMLGSLFVRERVDA